MPKNKLMWASIACSGIFSGSTVCKIILAAGRVLTACATEGWLLTWSDSASGSGSRLALHAPDSNDAIVRGNYSCPVWPNRRPWRRSQTESKIEPMDPFLTTLLSSYRQAHAQSSSQWIGISGKTDRSTCLISGIVRQNVDRNSHGPRAGASICKSPTPLTVHTSSYLFDVQVPSCHCVLLATRLPLSAGVCVGAGDARTKRKMTSEKGIEFAFGDFIDLPLGVAIQYNGMSGRISVRMELFERCVAAAVTA